MSISPSRNASIPGSAAKSRGRVVFFTPAEHDNSNYNKDSIVPGSRKPLRKTSSSNLFQQQELVEQQRQQPHQDFEEFVPDIDYNDVLPLSLQLREEMQMLMDEQEAYEEAKRKESLKKSVLASDHHHQHHQHQQQHQLHDDIDNDDHAEPSADIVVAVQSQQQEQQQEQQQHEHLQQQQQQHKRREYHRILHRQFMDVHSFGYALPTTLEEQYREYASHPSQKSKLARRPVEFECSAEITDEFHGEDLDDAVRDALLQERIAAQQMSHQASVSATNAAQWDLDRLYFIATDISSDDSEGATEDIESEWRQETSRIYQACRRLESAVLSSSCGRGASARPSGGTDSALAKLEQEQAATEFVDLIKSLHGHKCAPLLSAYANAARTEQSVANHDLLGEDGQAADGDDDNDDDDKNEVEESENDEHKQKTPPPPSKQRQQRATRGNYQRASTRTLAGTSLHVSFAATRNGSVKNKALESVPLGHVTPTERSMLWDALRKVYQFAEPVHAKRWLSATSRLHDEPTFFDYYSVSTVSHIFFAAVRHLKECLPPRNHDKLKRWANRCLYLIQRRSLTLKEFGVSQPTFKAVNVSCAGGSREVPMETTRLPAILTLISDLHDHKIKQEKKAQRLILREQEIRKRKDLFVANHVAAASSNHCQLIRNQNPERRKMLVADAEKSWDEYGNAMMLQNDDELLLLEDDSDDDDEDDEDGYDEDEEEDDDDAEAEGGNKNLYEQIAGSNVGISMHQLDRYQQRSGDAETAVSSSRAPTATNRSSSKDGESSSEYGGTQSRRSSRSGSPHTSDPQHQQHQGQQQRYQAALPNRSRRSSRTGSHYEFGGESSNIFQTGDRVFFDYNERKRLEEERIARQQQMDPRKKKKEVRAMKRARMFAELKRSAMEERAQQELKAELMSYRGEFMNK